MGPGMPVDRAMTRTKPTTSKDHGLVAMADILDTVTSVTADGPPATAEGDGFFDKDCSTFDFSHPSHKRFDCSVPYGRPLLWMSQVRQKGNRGDCVALSTDHNDLLWFSWHVLNDERPRMQFGHSLAHKAID